MHVPRLVSQMTLLLAMLSGISTLRSSANAEELADLTLRQSSKGRLNIDLSVAESATTFKLPEGTQFDLNLLTFNGRYSPEVWQLAKGDRLRVRMTNKQIPGNGRCDADPANINLHTHGLVVPATGNGDNMAVQICPRRNGSPSNNKDPIKNGVHHYNMKLSNSHADGLNWFHPHVHGAALKHVGAGMSGLISVGPPAISGVRVRYLALRDLQLVDKAPQYNQTIDGSYCAGAPTGQGHCKQVDKKVTWIFPVNGQIYPTVTIAPGSAQLLRIANTSANATYRLALGNGAQLCVVAADGVFIDAAKRALFRAGSTCPGILRSEIILLPAARAEILVDAPKADTTLKTLGFVTGPRDSTGKVLAGDTFPSIELVKLTTGTIADAPQAIKQQPNIGYGSLLLPPGETCVADHASQTRQEVRYITLALKENGAKQFKIGAAIGKVSDAKRPEPVQFQSHAGHGVQKPAICAKWNNGTEVWRIENHSNELHNFHLHQVKFRVKNICNPDSSGKCIEAGGEPLLCGTQSATAAAAIRAPDKSAAGISVSAGKVSINSGMHDTVPVPCSAVDVSGATIVKPRSGDPKIGWQQQDEAKYPGWVEIEVTFDQPEHIGRYLMHCHILEHQDNGMMAEVVVRK